VARGRRSPRPLWAGSLPPWPLDPPAVATPPTAPTAAHGPVATPTAPGATRPSVRTFFCKQCRRGVDGTDPPTPGSGSSATTPTSKPATAAPT
jgi:hypothetical protein